MDTPNRRFSGLFQPAVAFASMSATLSNCLLRWNISARRLLDTRFLGRSRGSRMQDFDVTGSDYTVAIAYIVVVIAIGLWFSRSQKD